MNHNLITSFVALSVIAVITACKIQKTDTTLKIIGGTKDNVSYPEAIKLGLMKHGLSTYCSGTIVREDLVLTAAHCIVDADYAFLYLSDDKVGPSNETFVIFPNFRRPLTELEWDLSLNSDVAFVVFPRGSFAGHAIGKIAPSSPKEGDAVHLVGYGQTELKTQGIRHVGSNTVRKIMPSLANSIVLTTTAVGTSTSVSAPGDSGGPLFNSAGEIVGVTASGGMHLDITTENPRDSFYVNLNDPGVAEFIKIVMSTPDPTKSTAQSIKATPTHTMPVPPKTSSPPNSKNSRQNQHQGLD